MQRSTNKKIILEFLDNNSHVIWFISQAFLYSLLEVLVLLNLRFSRGKLSIDFMLI